MIAADRASADAGPLTGLKIIEIESIGPGPFAAMTLADLGANVLRIARPSRIPASNRNPVLCRGRSGTLALDFKNAADVQRLLALIGCADALIEGFRPDVMERLGLGPDACLLRNPKLVYGRVTGWGRTGPLALTAGHDINYIALTGALHACGTAASGPIPPLNLVGDFGGGGLMLAFGIVCALLEARTSARGQIVDAAMTDGASVLMAMLYGMRAQGRWPAERAGNILDGSAYFTRSTNAPTAGWPWAPSRLSFGWNCCGCSDSARTHRPSCGPTPTIRTSVGGSPRFSKRARGPHGSRCSTVRTPVSRQCFTWTRSSRMSRMPRGPRSPASTACCSRIPRRASAGPRPHCPAER